MATGLHLEQYLDSLENLPTELQRNFHLMRDLDQRAQDVMRNIDQISDEYLSGVKGLSPEKRSEQMSKIQKMFNRAKEYSDDKVQLAIQTYELVDKHIRRLDSDLAKFEAEIKEKALNNNKKEEDTSSKKKGRKKKEEKGKHKRKGVNQSDEEETTPKPGRKKQKKKMETDSASKSVIPCLSIAHPSDVMDMPVDPNEPTYCLCHQVSYGEMIACDKMDCPIEWFHFACVGLTTKPKGKWYCPKCSTERKKK
ncbi:inhibitor of growth protein 5 isoform X1 [Penaeus vannamei]|uniref:Inhibitor of growth protein n=1 Tax=Penaeus vannamei TaxID=6689 RepID=A0A3R7LUQ9_PENVA|nr:inhibitor of growth protein 5-like isoform X1 [Penaeus vannamei]ROT64894.1 putative inhibitor of growth protein 5 isoform X3 [Penaeus vannamei]